MSSHQVHAVVVTFHPDDQVVGNLSALRAQVEDVVVVDNGSQPGEIAMLRRESSRIGFRLIENGANLGIASALNIGIRQAMAECRTHHRRDSLLLMFDQDSRITDAFTETMLNGFLTHPAGDRLGLLAPVYRDMRFGRSIRPERIAAGGLEVAMTSGTLLRLATFERHGFFIEELFIDGVDHEFSLRLRKAGLRIEECERAVLLHSPGTPKFHRIGGWSFQTANYAPVRRYYQERNKIWIYKRYLVSFPRYCGRLFLVSIKDFAKILFVERGKGPKIGHFLRGVLDGILGRMGRLAP